MLLWGLWVWRGAWMLTLGEVIATGMLGIALAGGTLAVGIVLTVGMIVGISLVGMLLVVVTLVAVKKGWEWVEWVRHLKW